MGTEVALAGGGMAAGLDAVLMRGGTSRGPVLLADAVPADVAERDRLLVHLIGGEVQQVDGVGGGGPVTSKVVLVQPRSGDPDGVDFDYAVGNVVVGHDAIDWAGTCGNMTATVPLYAFEERLTRPARDKPIRIRNLSTGGLIDTTLQVAADHLSGQGAVVTTTYLRPGGSVFGSVLPTGRATETLELDGRSLQASLVDVTHPYLFLLHDEVAGTTDMLTADVLAFIERVRGTMCVRLGLVDVPEAAMAKCPAIPRVVLLDTAGTRALGSGPAIRITAVSMGSAITSVPVTAAMCLAAACRMPGTLPHRLCAGVPDGAWLDVVGPKARLAAGSTLEQDGTVASAFVDRTARSIMRGTVWPAA